MQNYFQTHVGRHLNIKVTQLHTEKLILIEYTRGKTVKIITVTFMPFSITK